MNKNFIKLLFLLYLCFHMYENMFSQDQCGNTAFITTNPDNPINEKDTYPNTKLNNFFDWRIESIPIYSSAPYLQGSHYVISPFWDSDAEYNNQVYKNFKPEDGWELLKINRGYVDETIHDQSNQIIAVPESFSLNKPKKSPETYLWLVMYNKYISIMRVFVLIGESRSYTGAKMSLYFTSDANDNIFTNLIGNFDSEAPLIAVDEISKIKFIDLPILYDNNPNRWLYADFPVMYDPCTCRFQSELVINVRLIRETKINFEGIDETNSVSQNFEKPSTLYEDEQTQILGEIIEEFPYSNIIINNPGGNNHNLVAHNENTANYDQVLGTFNLLRTPIVEYYNSDVDVPWPPSAGSNPPYIVTQQQRYRIKDDIEFVINPAAGFKTNIEDIDVMAALVFEFDEPVNNEMFMKENQNIIEREDTKTYRTKFLPLHCLNEAKITFSGTYKWNHTYKPPLMSVPKVYVKIQANLKRKDDGPDVIFVGKYPVKIEFDRSEHNASWEQSWTSEMSNFPKNIKLENTTIMSNVFAWDTITIGSGVTIQGGPYIIQAGSYIKRLPESINSPQLILKIGLEDICDATKYGPVTNVQSFCSSNQANGYKPELRQMSRIPPIDRNKRINFFFDIFPNPTSNILNLRINTTELSPLKVVIRNLLGETILIPIDKSNYPIGEYTIPIDVSHFSSGVYFCTLFSPQGIITKTFMFIR